MKKLMLAILFSSFIFLTPSAITANKSETKILNEDKIIEKLDKNTLAEKLEEHLKQQVIDGMKKIMHYQIHLY